MESVLGCPPFFFSTKCMFYCTHTSSLWADRSFTQNSATKILTKNTSGDSVDQCNWAFISDLCCSHWTDCVTSGRTLVDSVDKWQFMLYTNGQVNHGILWKNFVARRKSCVHMWRFIANNSSFSILRMQMKGTLPKYGNDQINQNYFNISNWELVKWWSQQDKHC